MFGGIFAGQFVYLKKIEKKIVYSHSYIDVLNYGAVGDGVIDDTNAFRSAIEDAEKYSLPLYIPIKTFLISDPLYIHSGIAIYSHGATLIHDDVSGPIISATGIDNWSIEGLILKGALHQVNQQETGIFISGSTHYSLQHITIRDFHGYGINIESGKASQFARNRGDHGQFSNISLINNNIGMNIGSGTNSEYSILTMMSFSSNRLGLSIEAGNVIMTASNIVDNDSGLQLSNGVNHGKGIFNAVNITHNRDFNIKIDNQENGYTFTGCHIFGGGPIILNHSTGIHFDGMNNSPIINDGYGRNFISFNQ